MLRNEVPEQLKHLPGAVSHDECLPILSLFRFLKRFCSTTSHFLETAPIIFPTDFNWKNIHFFSREVSFWRSLVINPSITANSDRPDTYDQLPTGGYPGKNRMFEIFQFYSITMGYKNKALLSRNSSKMVLDVLKCAKNVWESALRFIRLLIGSHLTVWLSFSNFIGIPWILN